MEVAELVATLALSIDEGAWKRAEELISKVKTKAKETGEETKKAGEEAESGWGEFTNKLKEGLETLIGYEGIKTFTEMLEHTQELAFQTSKLAQRIGITTQALQGLTYAAQQSDVSSDSLQYGLQRLAYNVSVVGEHSQWTDSALAKIGMTTTEITAKLKKGAGIDEVLSDIAERFKSMPDGATKASVAMQLFGRTAGPEMIPLLDKGKDGIEALKKEAEDLGIVLDKENIEAVNENEKAQRRLQAQWEGLKFTLMTQLIPAVHVLIDAFSKVVFFFQKHREFLYAVLAGIAAAILAIGTAATLAWWEVIAPVAALIAAVTAIVAAFEYGIEALEGKFGTRAKHIAAAILIFLGPLGMVIIAIYEIKKHWEQLASVFKPVVEWLEEAWSAIADHMDVIEDIAIGLVSPFLLVVRALTWVVEKLDQALSKAKTAGTVISDALDFIPGVGIARAGYGLATGQGAGALWHALPGLSAGRDVVRHFTGGSGGGTQAATGGEMGNNVEIHNSVTIHTGADPDAVKQVVNDALDKSMRDAHKAVKKGG